MDLKFELLETLAGVNQSIADVEAEAERRNLPAASLVNKFGQTFLIPLLLAKAQILHSLVLLEATENGT